MNDHLLEMSANLVAAHLSQNRMHPNEVLNFLRDVHSTLHELNGARPSAAAPKRGVEAVPIANSVQNNSIQAAMEDESSHLVAEDLPPAEALHQDVFNGRDEASELNISNRIAFARDNDLDDPVFAGIDPWLAARISPMVARKLDTANELHPTVFKNTLICLEDGANVTLLRAYIRKRFGLTPEQYKEKWNLPDEYPMSPPEYVEKKRNAALKAGLGRSVRASREKPKAPTGGSKADTPATTKSTLKKVSDAPSPKPRGRPRKNPAVPVAAPGAGRRRTLSPFEEGK